MWNKRRKLTPSIMIALLAASTVTGDDYEVDRYTIDGGGEMFSSGGDFELSGTVGQPDAGTSTGGDYALTGGFWFGQVCGDCNYDGGIDLGDFQAFDPCLSGPGGGLDAGCGCLDFDGDEDADLADFARFQVAFTGSGG